jgi:cation:H+ antiporter
MLFEDLSPWLNGAIFLAAALVVWKAGSQLAQRADGIARKTGLGSAVLGIFLLGGITSLPELAVGVSATLSGAPELSVNDVLGSAAINVVILAGADAVYGRKALTSTPATPEVLLQGMLGIVLLALVVGATLAGDVLVGGMGAWSWAILVAYLAALWIVSKSQGLHTWHPDRPAVPAPPPEHQQGQPQERSLRRLVAGAAVAGAVILVASCSRRPARRWPGRRGSARASSVRCCSRRQRRCRRSARCWRPCACGVMRWRCRTCWAPTCST